MSFTLVFSLFGCQKAKEEQPSLVGKWSCVRIEEDTGDVFTYAASEMNYVFQFSDNGKYTWDSSKKMRPWFSCGRYVVIEWNYLKSHQL